MNEQNHGSPRLKIALLAFPLFTSLFPAAAAPLISSTTTQLTLPASTGSTQPGIAPTLATASGSFTGTWSAPVQTPWQGTFYGTGTYPSNTTSGTNSVWDFISLVDGDLPADTYFVFGDLDSGTSEQFILTAYDGNGDQLTQNWLNAPSYVFGLNAADRVQGNMPEYSVSNGVYTFDGGGLTTGTNPTIAVFLQNNIAISYLWVQKSAQNNSFGLQAPSAAPEPGSVLLLCSGLGAIARRKLSASRRARLESRQ